jgi:voltage-gated potassium channel
VTVRERYRAFVHRHEVAWELAFAGLAVVFVALAFIPIESGSQAESLVFQLEWVITGLFIAEFTSRLWAAESRRTYLRGHWIDLISCLPPGRWLRTLRLLRLLRLVRTFAGVGRALTSFERFSQHRGLIWLLVAWFGVMLFCAVGFYISEFGSNESVAGPLDALWWGLTTMTTVGYGEVYPVTPEGRVAAAVLMVFGIGLYSLVTATVTSVLISGRKDRDVPEQLERLAKLHLEERLTDTEYAAAKASVIGSGSNA